MKITDIDAATQTTVERDATKEEIAEFKALNDELAAKKAEADAKAKSDSLAKDALLDRLGITAEEAALLLA